MSQQLLDFANEAGAGIAAGQRWRSFRVIVQLAFAVIPG